MFQDSDEDEFWNHSTTMENCKRKGRGVRFIMNKWNKIKSTELYKELYGSIFSPVLTSLIGMIIQIAIIKIALDLLFSL